MSAPTDHSPRDPFDTLPDTVVLDLDGTLVDSVPVHVLAWQAAFRDVGVHVPTHRLHPLIGMGGDRLVAHAAGDAVEHPLGEELRARHPERLDELFARIVPTEGAADLLTTLRDLGVRPVLAGSSEAGLTDRLLDVLSEARHLLVEVVTGSDAEESKPAGDLVAVALRSAGAGTAVAVGDSEWDVHAAADAGVACVCVRTGGFTEAVLREAGAAAVHETPAALAAHLRAGTSPRR